jgi:hypothetical protein
MHPQYRGATGCLYMILSPWCFIWWYVRGAARDSLLYSQTHECYATVDFFFWLSPLWSVWLCGLLVLLIGSRGDHDFWIVWFVCSASRIGRRKSGFAPVQILYLCVFVERQRADCLITIKSSRAKSSINLFGNLIEPARFLLRRHNNCRVYTFCLWPIC